MIESKSLVFLDVPTRWNSKYMMLDASLKFQKAFERMEEDDGHYLGYYKDNDTGRRRVGPSLLMIGKMQVSLDLHTQSTD